MKNKYGLSRSIPSEIKQKIRKNSGFGCVICGNFLYEFEHILPEFNNAKEHNPDSICLLCPNCHSKVQKQLISKKEVMEAYKNPYTIKKGFSREDRLFKLEVPFSLSLGSIDFYNPNVIIQLYNSPIFSISTDTNGIIILNAYFKNKKDVKILEIINNEWRPYVNNFDVKLEGNKISIINENEDTSFEILYESMNKLKFQKLHLNFPEFEIKNDGNELLIYNKLSNSKLTGNLDVSTNGPIIFSEQIIIKGPTLMVTKET